MSVSLMTERPPYIEFKILTEEDREQSIATGAYKSKDVDFVSIMPAGDRNLKVDRRVDEWLDQLTQRVKQGMGNVQHLDYFKTAYKTWKETQEIPVNGTPIKAWPVISPSQAQNILSANIRTIEDLAMANEETLTRIGMGARALKERAVAWLGAANDTGKIAEENAAMKVQLAQLVADMAELRATNKQLITDLEKPKRGRPFKFEESEAVNGAA